MSKRINSKKELPKEFYLSKYESLESMSDKDLFRQLSWRNFDLENGNELGVFYGANYPMHNLCGDPFKEIPNAIDACYHKPEGTRPLKMSHEDGIKPLIRFDVEYINKLSAQKGRLPQRNIILDDNEFDELISMDSSIYWDVMLEPINMLNDSIDKMLISVDLNFRNDDLIDMFSKLLPAWRRECGVLEPEKPVAGGWASIRRKIIEYKIIPMIDLLSWAKASNTTISNGVLAVALFPDGEKDSIVIPQTIKPFLDKLLNGNSLDKIKEEISKEG